MSESKDAVPGVTFATPMTCQRCGEEGPTQRSRFDTEFGGVAWDLCPGCAASLERRVSALIEEFFRKPVPFFILVEGGRLTASERAIIGDLIKDGPDLATVRDAVRMFNVGRDPAFEVTLSTDVCR